VRFIAPSPLNTYWIIGIVPASVNSSPSSKAAGAASQTLWSGNLRVLQQFPKNTPHMFQSGGLGGRQMPKTTPMIKRP
jgi:hypothetical protein